MVFPVKDLLNGNELQRVKPETKLRDALKVMVGNDYSQMPVVDDDDNLLGMVTEHSIVTTYYLSSDSEPLLDLPVEHCQTAARTLPYDADIFTVLDALEQVYAVVIVDGEKPKGIFTAYDATHFFRNLTEDLIVVRTIEETLRRYIEHVFPKGNPLDAALVRAFGESRKEARRPAKEYDQLTFDDHIQVITTEGNWSRFEPYLSPKKMLRTYMDEVCKIRNQLAHFRGELAPTQRKTLRQAKYWLEHRPAPFGMAPGGRSSEKDAGVVAGGAGSSV